MSPGRDFSCEIMGLIVLTILSALSHFWYIMVAVGILSGFAAVGLLLAILLLRVARQLLDRVLNPVPPQNARARTGIAVDDGTRPGSSLPA
jgi:hypothetical protein